MDKNKLNRIYEVAREFSNIAKKYAGISYFSIGNIDNFKKNRYFRYFEKMEQYAEEGKIKLPDLIESVFQNSKKKKIMPNEILSKKNVNKWLMNKEDPEDVPSLDLIILNSMMKIKEEIKRDEFKKRFLTGKIFNNRKFLKFKIVTDDVIIKLLRRSDKKEILKVMKEIIEDYGEDPRLNSIAECDDYYIKTLMRKIRKDEEDWKNFMKYLIKNGENNDF